ncbi:hypothetical protein EH32_07180 [Erythrobacter litoralis]|uniref:Uncharacterized protein n=1 Tax=Erythrobacter litoralis TaxID=39960 RepID=A0A074N1T0_9SPHN|nr:hypothetical protein [Erythrobacter litoralis]KEO98880.1 hypothetical protein EH32_07180 [Erythrobacter litoralis]
MERKIPALDEVRWGNREADPRLFRLGHRVLPLIRRQADVRIAPAVKARDAFAIIIIILHG